MRKTAILATALAAVLIIGCGSGAPGGGDSSGGTVPLPPIVTLDSLTVNPSHPAIDLGDATPATVFGHYSDGAILQVPADWTSNDVLIATVSSPQSTSVTIAGVGEGSTTIHVSFGGVSVDVPVDVLWEVPTDPGTLYAQGLFGTIWRYPSDGGAPTAIRNVRGPGFGFVQTPTALYQLIRLGGSYPIFRIDPLTGAATQIATLPYDTNCWSSLDINAQGQLVSGAYGSGDIALIDSITGVVSILPNANMGGYCNLRATFDPDGLLYCCGIFPGPNNALITKYDPATNTQSTYVDDQLGWVIPGCLEVNIRNETYLNDISGTVMWKFVDVNGDGDACDVSERSDFAQIPGAAYDYYAIGASLTRGRGLLLNLCPAASVPGGILFMADRNGDGDAMDPGEVTMYNPNPTDNDGDPGSISAPH